MKQPRRIFVGRERELVQVEEALKKGNQARLPQNDVAKAYTP